jgi:hypothetical protein
MSEQAFFLGSEGAFTTLCFYSQDEMPKAEATLRHATEIQPKGFGYHLALGATLKYEGRLLEAKRAGGPGF